MLRKSIHHVVAVAWLFLHCILPRTASPEPFVLGQLNKGLLESSANLAAEITLTRIPLEFYKEEEIITIAWADDRDCLLRYDVTPGGGVPSNYANRTEVSGRGSLSFTPQSEGIGVGIYFCVISTPDGSASSVEFKIVVESDQGVVGANPEGGITDIAPSFAWQANPGVPYYNIILSDHPFQIETTVDESGEETKTVKGVSVIWQAITPNTSITYGDPDPSGITPRTTVPPLLFGNTYNWIVLNNYGNTLSTSSDVTGSPRGFWLTEEPELEAPTLISPADGSVLNVFEHSTITFQWSEVAQASAYHLFLFMHRVEEESDVNILIWDGLSSDPLIDFPAEFLLTDLEYTWKVGALDESGRGVVSGTFSFTYETVVGTLDILTFDKQAKQMRNEKVVVPYVTVELFPIEGVVETTPIVMGDDGHFEKFMAPGTYISRAWKEGYEAVIDTFVIEEDPFPDRDDERGDTYHEIYLPPSPSIVHGRVVDAKTGGGVIGADVVFLSDGQERSTKTDLNGNFSMSLSPGSWQITATKANYLSAETIQTVQAGTNIDVGELAIRENQYQLFGTVKNARGQLLWGVEVSVDDGMGTTFSDVTDGEGRYSVKVTPGEWTITATKVGYASPPPLVKSILGGDLRVDLTLKANANLVKGKVTDGKVPVSGATIRAVPPAGDIAETTTDTYGNYTLSLPTGTYIVSVQKRGYTSPPEINIAVGVTVSVGETKAGLDFVLMPDESIITGRVTSDGMRAVTDALVTNGDKVIRTEDDGTYRLEVLAGTYIITVSKEGYSSLGGVEISVRPGEEVSGVDLRLAPNASVIKGAVRSAGAGVFDAEVAAIPARGAPTSVKTDPSGGYTISLSPGTYDLVARKKGFKEVRKSALMLGTGVTLTGVDFDLVEFSSLLRGTVTDGVLPLREAAVTVTTDDFSTVTVTDIRGEFSLTLESETTYTVTVSREGYTSVVLSAGPLIPGAVHFLPTITLQALPSTISGRTLTTTGDPLGRATVTASGEEGDFQVESDAYGQYTLNLLPDIYTLIARKPGYKDSETIPVAVGPGEHAEEVTLALEENLSALFGTVVRGDESVLPGVRVVAKEQTTNTGATVSTASDGSFLIEKLLPGTYTITLSEEGYITHLLQDEALSGGIARGLGRIVLIRKVGSISGIIEGHEGTATVSATNLATGAGSYALTDEVGSYRIEGLSPGTYAVQVNLVGFSSFPDSISVEVEVGEISGVNFTMRRNLGVIEGSVVDEDGVGLGGATVTADDGRGNFAGTRTDPTGRYAIRNLPETPGGYLLKARLLGYESLVESLRVEVGTKDADFQMRRVGKAIHGTIVNQLGTMEGLPQSISLKVTSSGVPPKTAVARREQDYAFVVGDLAPGQTYTIRADILEQGFIGGRTTVTMGEPDTADVSLTVDVHRASLSGSVGVVGANIIAVGKSNGETYTTFSQPDGSFLLQNILGDPEGYVVTAVKSGFLTKSLETDPLGLLESKDLGERLRLIRAEAGVSGKVITALEGWPMPDVRVVAVSADGRSSGADSTDAEGRYLIPDLSPNNSYTVGTVLDPQKFDNARISVDLEVGTLDVRDLVIPVHNGVILGKVITSDETPIGEALVELAGRISGSAVSGSDGAFTFENLYPGSYRVSVRKAGFLKPDPEKVVLGEGEEVSLSFKLQAQRNVVFGKVTSEDGHHLPNVIVTIPGSGADTTDILGAFSIGDLPPGTYTISAGKLGFLDHISPPFEVSAGGVERNILLQPSPSTLFGTVMRGDTGLPAVGATVEARSKDGELRRTVTDTFGDYAILLPFGTFFVSASLEDRISRSEVVSGGAPIRLNLEVVKAASLSGRLTAGGVGIPDASVVIQNLQSNEPLEVYTGADGGYSLGGLLPGDYRIFTSARGLLVEDSPRDILLERGAGVRADFEGVPVGSTLRGLVAAEDGEPIREALISARTRDGVTLTAPSRGSGGYLFEELPPGVYEVSVSAVGFKPSESVSVEVVGDRALVQNFTLTAAANSISGAVFDSRTGRPLEAVSVALFSEVKVETSVETGRDGVYLFEDVPPGAYTIRAEKASFTSQPESLKVSLQEGQWVSRADFVMIPSIQPADISGVVTHGDRRIEGARLIVTSQDLSTVDTTSSDAQGQYLFSDLAAPDVYRIRVTSPGLPPLTSEAIQLQEGGARVDFRFPSAQIRFVITKDLKTPLEGMKIRVRGPDLDLPLASDMNGHAQTPPTLKSGQYQVTVATGGYRVPPLPYRIQLQEGEARTEEIALALRHEPPTRVAAVDTFRVEIISDLPDLSLWREMALFVRRAGETVFEPLKVTPDEDKGAFVAEVVPSPEIRSGQLSYYIRAEAPLRRFSSNIVDTTRGGLSYSNETSPYTTNLSARGVLAVVELGPPDVILPFGGQMVFEVHSFDEEGTNLGSDILSSGAVMWEIVSPDPLGSTITPDPDDALKATLSAGNKAGLLKIQAKVNLHDVWISSRTTVDVRDITLTRLKFLGEVKEALLGGSREKFLIGAVGRTPEGEEFDIPVPKPTWSLEPEAAGSIDDGLFVSSGSYIGEAIISAAHRDLETNTTVQIFQQLIPSEHEVTLGDGRGFVLSLSPWAMKVPAQVRLDKIVFPEVKRLFTPWEVVGMVYRVTFNVSEPFTKTADIRMALPLPEGTDPGRAWVAYWNREELQWMELPTSAVLSRSLEAEMPPSILAKYSQYALLLRSKPLGLESLSLLPNPFSPDVDADGENGLSITYRVSSDKARSPFVTIKVYNMEGILVRTLVHNERQAKSQLQKVVWDGKTDSGREARNGRYVLQIQVKDSSGVHEELRTIVLIK